MPKREKTPRNPNSGRKQPANSSKAAEALGKTGGILGFSDFGSAPATAGYASMAVNSGAAGGTGGTGGAMDTGDITLPPDLQTNLRKLSKRDATTKVKALFQLSQFKLSSLPDHDMKTLLLQWPRLFARLTTEYDHMVREASVRFHDAVVRRSGKLLEPQLKALVPHWIRVMFDSHSPTAKFAKSSWLATFGQGKVAKVLTVCLSQCLKYVVHNILEETPESLCELNPGSEEERQTRYERLVASSLLSLDYLLTSLNSDDRPEESLSEQMESMDELLSDKKFWKLSRHSSSTIQTSFYGLLAGLCKSLPRVVTTHLDSIAQVSLACLDKSDSNVCVPLWETVLLLVSDYTDCWKAVNVEKGVFPGLFKALSCDNATTLSSIIPNVLPLLSKIPAELQGEFSISEPVPHFLTRFFQSLRESFYNRRLDDSHRRLVVSCFLDCLRFTLLHIPMAEEVMKGDITVEEISSALLETQLLPVIEAALNDRIPTSVVFDHLNSFLRLLLKRIHTATTGEMDSETPAVPGPTMDLLPEIFWEEFEALLSKEVNRPGQTKAKLEKVSNLLVRLSLSLRDENRPSLYSLSLEQDPAYDTLYLFLDGVASQALAFAHEHGSTDHLRIFSRVLRTPVGQSALRYALSCLSCHKYVVDIQQSYPQVEVFTGFEDMAHCPTDHVAEVFLQWVILPWLLESICSSEEQAPLPRHSSMMKLCLVEVAFAAVLHAPAVQRVQLLEQLCRVCGQDVLVLCAMVRQAILWLQDHEGAIFVQDWLSSASLGERLVVHVWKATNAASPPLALFADVTIYEGREVPDSSISAELSIWHSVHLLLRPGSGKEVLMSSEHAEIILAHTWQLFEESLPDRSKALIAALQLAQSYFDSLMEGGKMLDGAKTLLYTLFKATCDPDPAFNSDVIEHMRNVWKCGLAKFAKQRPEECLSWVEQVSEWSHDVLLSSALTTLASVKELADTLMSVLDLTRTAGVDTRFAARVAALIPNKQRWELSRVLAGRSGTCTSSLVEGSLSLYELVADSFPAASEPSTVRRMSANKLFRRRSSDAAVRRASHPAPSVHTQCAVFSCQLLSQYQQIVKHEHLRQGISTVDNLAQDMTERQIFSGFYKEQLVGLCTELAWDIQWLYGVPRVCRELYNMDDADAITWAALPILEPVVPQLLRELKHRNALPFVFGSVKIQSEENKLIWSAVFQRLLEESASLGFTVASCELAELPTQFAQQHHASGNQVRTLQALFSVMGRDGNETEVAALQSICLQLEKTITSTSADALCNNKTGLFGALCACVSALVALSSVKGGGRADKKMISRLLSHVMTWRDQDSNLFFFDCDLTACQTQHISATMEILRLVHLAVVYCPQELSPDQWDFILCSLLAWFQTCRQTQPHTISNAGLLSAAARNEGLLRCLHFTTFCCHSNKLLSSVVRLLQKPDSAVPSALKESWESWCAHAVYQQFVPLFMSCADTASVALSLGRDPVITCLHQLLEHLSLSIHLMPADLVEGDSNEAKLLLALLQGELDEIACEGSDLCKEFARRMSFINPVVPVLGGSLPSLLLSPSCSVQAAAFSTISKMVPAVVKKADENLQAAKAEGNEGSLVRLPADLTMLIEDRCDELESWISSQPEYKLGKQVNIPRANVIYRTATGYLLAWQLLLLILNRAGPELRAQYASGLRDGAELSSLMKVMFSLMPKQPPSSMLKPVLAVGQPTRTLPLPRMIHGGCDHRAVLWWSVPEVACHLYLSAMQQIPVLVRQWWNTIDRGFYQLVERFTTQHVSPIILEQEFSAIPESAKSLHNMEIRVRPSAREVLAIYSAEDNDIKVELTVELAQCHPLRPAKVECTKNIGVKTEEWRRWLLQLTTFLANQNGSIFDGLALWKRSLDRRFEGLEDCMICFSVIHGSNCSLPKLSCRTCKKKFHSACLYKWFNTSNASTCPLCRNLF